MGTNNKNANNEAATTAAAEVSTEQNNALVIQNNFLSNPDAIFSELEKNGEPWIDLSATYKTLEPGETIDVIKTGQSQRDLSGDGEPKKVIEFITRAQDSIIMADVVIVSALWDKENKPYRIICTGKQKSGAGHYKTFKVLTW